MWIPSSETPSALYSNKIVAFGGGIGYNGVVIAADMCVFSDFKGEALLVDEDNCACFRTCVQVNASFLEARSIMGRNRVVLMVFVLAVGSGDIARADLLAHYNFDETGGSVAHDSTGGNDGTINNGSWGTPGAQAHTGPGHLVLSGDQANVSVTGLPASVGDFTIMTWLNKTNMVRFSWFIGTSSGATNLQISIDEENQSGYMAVGCGGIWKDTMTGYSSNKWQHIAFIRYASSGNVEFYVNGELETTFVCGPGEIDLSTFMIGNWPSAWSNDPGKYRPCSGGYDDFGVWNEALDVDEIAGFMEAGISLSATVEFEEDSSGADESMAAEVEVVLDKPRSGSGYTVDYSVVGGTADGAGVDYTLDAGTLVFDPGETSKRIQIGIVDDGLNEDDETIIIELSNPSGEEIELGKVTQHTYTIVDPRPAVAFDTATGSGLEGAGEAVVSVSLSQALGETATVDYAVVDGTATGGGVDYTLDAGTLSFAPGVVTQQISISIVDDEIDEYPDETIELALSNPSSNIKLLVDHGHVYTIVDNEYGPTFVNSLGMEFVRINPGIFTMGAGNDPKILDLGDNDYDEQPAHLVEISKRFYMLKGKVSQSHYQQAGLPGSVSDISWDNAAAFCEWLSNEEGRTYRLPTEAEWQYVSENPQGAANMSGREWTQDWHGLYPTDYVVDPVGPAVGIMKVIRGDSNDRQTLPPCATSSPWGLDAVSFRVVLDIDPLEKPFVSAPAIPQMAITQSTEPALIGPDPNVPYFTVRFSLPIPPENSTNGIASMLGVSPALMYHNHSPGFEILPNGDALAVWFTALSNEARDEQKPNTRLVQARLRYGSDQWDMPGLFYDFKHENDQHALMWTEGETIWLFCGGLGMSDRLPFKIAKSTDSGATWRMELPLVDSPARNYSPQPAQNAFRAPNGDIYFAMDGEDVESFLWRSSDGGTTWHDMGGRTSTRHSTIVPLDGNGTVLSVGGKKNGIDDFNIWDKSYNWGASWPERGATPFSELSPNQRPCAIVMANGNIAFCSDAQTHYGNRPPGINHPPGCIVAISEDNASTWHIKNLPVTLPHEEYTSNWRLGYSTIRQAPNGVLHILATMTHPGLHYEMNEAWVFSGEGDIAPETSGGAVNSYSEDYPSGQLKTSWSARTCANGRYLLDGVQTCYYPDGGKEYEVTYENGRKTGSETYWTSDGAKAWSWRHDATDNTSIWMHYWANGLRRIESHWSNFPQARDNERNFSGFIAEGPTYHWDRTGQPVNAWTFSAGDLAGSAPLPEPQVKTADLTDNNCVDFDDLMSLIENWLWSGPAGGYNVADMNIDGTVNIEDYAVFAAQWRQGCP